MRGLLIALASLALAAPAAHSQGQARSADLVTLSCADFLAAARIAVPGENPSPERLAQAQAAQDDIAHGLVWVHGYLSGRGAKVEPLSEAWLQATAERLAQQCGAAAEPGRARLVELMGDAP